MVIVHCDRPKLNISTWIFRFKWEFLNQSRKMRFYCCVTNFNGCSFFIFLVTIVINAVSKLNLETQSTKTTTTIMRRNNSVRLILGDNDDDLMTLILCRTKKQTSHDLRSFRVSSSPSQSNVSVHINRIYSFPFD